MKGKSLITALTALSLSLPAALSSPADPRPQRLILSSGEEITVVLRGDEFGSWYEDASGNAFTLSSEGFLEPADKESILQGIRRRSAGMRSTGGSMNPDLLSAPILVALISFEDGESFSYAEEWKAFFGQGDRSLLDKYALPGDMVDYWRQNAGVELSFYVDEIQVPHDIAHYGKNDASGNDSNFYELRHQALKQFGKSETSPDNIILVFAGKGENSGGGPDTIWPKNSGLGWMLDGVGTLYNAEQGQNGRPAFGSMVHEFGHSMGLPDLYDVNGSQYGTAGHLPDDCSVMCRGCYNGDGLCPPNLCSIERLWIKEDEVAWTPISLNGESRIDPLMENRNLYYLENRLYPDERCVIEYRPREGWDRDIHSTKEDAVFYILDRRTYTMLPMDKMTIRERFDSRRMVNAFQDHPLVSRWPYTVMSEIKLWDIDVDTDERIPMGVYIDGFRKEPGGAFLRVQVSSWIPDADGMSNIVITARMTDGQPVRVLTVDNRAATIRRLPDEGQFLMQIPNSESDAFKFYAGEGNRFPVYKRIHHYVNTCVKAEVVFDLMPEMFSWNCYDADQPTVDIPVEGPMTVYGTVSLNESVPQGYLLEGFRYDYPIDCNNKPLVSVWKITDIGIQAKEPVFLNMELQEDQLFRMDVQTADVAERYLVSITFQTSSKGTICLKRCEAESVFEGRIRTFNYRGNLQKIQETLSFPVSAIIRKK